MIFVLREGIENEAPRDFENGSGRFWGGCSFAGNDDQG
jgi:hypothetical protein